MDEISLSHLCFPLPKWPYIKTTTSDVAAQKLNEVILLVASNDNINVTLEAASRLLKY